MRGQASSVCFLTSLPRIGAHFLQISDMSVESLMSADDVNFFFEMRGQIKLYHWQTYSFAQHKATDNLIESLDKTIDTYVEVYMGRYGRPKMTSRNSGYKLGNLSEKTMIKFLKDCIYYLEGPLVKKLKPVDTDLVNLRDEMLSELNQVMYLFTLH
jgi:hypothetical protein